MKSKLTPLHKAKIEAMYTHDKKTITQIAQETGVSARTIGRVLDEYGSIRSTAKLKGDAYKVMQTLQIHDIRPELLNTVLIKAKQAFEELAIFKQKPDLVKIRDQIVNLEESMYNSWLATVIHQREAKKHNVHVQTAMLNLQEKVDRNERANKEGTS